MEELYSKYADILEHQLPDKDTNNKLSNNLTEHSLYTTVLEFIKINEMSKVIVSLSGGVDSMVLLDILIAMKLEDMVELEIYCCHLNYNNRPESSDERQFLVEYCKMKSVELEYIDIDFKRCDTKRNTYEKDTRQMRYDYYKEMCDKYECSGVFLAHHKDDICENIFNNIMRGSREITDLTVITKKNTVLGVNVYRPMLDYYKEDILEIADNLHTPYFLDTTPDWSCRGKMRRNIFPQCDDCYTTNYKSSLLKLGKESDDINNILQKYIIDVVMTKVSYSPHEGIISIPNETILQESYVLKIILRKISHKYSIDTMKIKSVEHLSDQLKKKNVGKLKMTLLKNHSIVINIDSIHIVQNIN